MRAQDHGGSCILFLGRTLASSCPHGDDTSAVLGLRALAHPEVGLAPATTSLDPTSVEKLGALLFPAT